MPIPLPAPAAFAEAYLTCRHRPSLRPPAVPGPKFTPLKLDLGPLARRARVAAAAARALIDRPPPAVLNRHCPACEYRDRCQADAVARDDLSLLQGLTPFDVERQNRKGVFT